MNIGTNIEAYIGFISEFLQGSTPHSPLRAVGRSYSVRAPFTGCAHDTFPQTNMETYTLNPYNSATTRTVAFIGPVSGVSMLVSGRMPLLLTWGFLKNMAPVEASGRSGGRQGDYKVTL